MSHQETEKAPVTFNDVADSFSEEEWNLLHEWQKELYNTVMKEIHQAMLALGPLIANSVFSLRSKEKEEPCPMDSEECEKRQTNHHSISETSSISVAFLRKAREEAKFLKTRKKTDKREIIDCTSKGIQCQNSDNVLRKEWEFETSLTVHQNADAADCSINTSSAGFPFLKNELNARFMAHRCADEENITIPSSEHPGVAPVVSVSRKVEDVTYSMDQRNSAKRGSMTESTTLLHSSVSPFLKSESESGFMERHCAEGESGPSLRLGSAVIPPEGAFITAPPNLEKREQMNGPSGACPFLKTEPAASFMERQCANGQDNTSLTLGHAVADPAVPLSSRQEEEICSLTPQNSERRASINCPSENVMPTDIVSFKIKDEGHNYLTKYQDTEARESANRPIGNGILKRKRKNGDPIQSHEIIPCKTATGKLKPKGTNCMRQQWPESHPGVMGDSTAQDNTHFSMDTHLNLHQGASKLVAPDLYNDWESSVRKAKMVTCPQNLQQNVRQYLGTEPEQAVSQKESLVGHQRTLGDINPERNRPHLSTEHEKSVSPIRSFFGDQTTQFSDKPYTCSQCEKSFSQMASLNRHQRTHSKERPYQCSECEKSFNRKDNLIRHQRSHTGDFQSQLDMLPTSFELPNEPLFGPLQVLRRTFSSRD
ncbi:hypothetical protein NDU88_002952 [Pleurodeles waltl]|uniref:Uncharacterized protein n=1 Tax=Pleurodeles waltl TaxID=8319 RepID=A0AAV7M235_PLEWA|nr:hypothetical protein NDU88_002952 [Pleurodeles waltl]